MEAFFYTWDTETKPVFTIDDTVYLFQKYIWADQGAAIPLTASTINYGKNFSIPFERYSDHHLLTNKNTQSAPLVFDIIMPVAFAQ
jgi:hypothetical protein